MTSCLWSKKSRNYPIRKSHSEATQHYGVYDYFFTIFTCQTLLKKFQMIKQNLGQNKKINLTPQISDSDIRLCANSAP